MANPMWISQQIQFSEFARRTRWSCRITWQLPQQASSDKLQQIFIELFLTGVSETVRTARIDF